jgi:hypothetical protein
MRGPEADISGSDGISGFEVTPELRSPINTGISCDNTFDSRLNGYLVESSMEDFVDLRLCKEPAETAELEVLDWVHHVWVLKDPLLVSIDP